MTTAEKIEAMRAELATINPDDLAGAAREIATNLQILEGFGIDPFGMVFPDDPTDLEIFIDQAIGLLLALRGDELAPYDFRAYADAVGARA